MSYAKGAVKDFSHSSPVRPLMIAHGLALSLMMVIALVQLILFELNIQKQYKTTAVLSHVGHQRVLCQHLNQIAVEIRNETQSSRVTELTEDFESVFNTWHEKHEALPALDLYTSDAQYIQQIKARYESIYNAGHRYLTAIQDNDPSAGKDALQGIQNCSQIYSHAMGQVIQDYTKDVEQHLNTVRVHQRILFAIVCIILILIALILFWPLLHIIRKSYYQNVLIQRKLSRAISNLKHEVEVRRLAEARIKGVFDCAAVGILVINQHGIIEDINTEVEHQFGYTRDELLGHNVKILMPSPYHEKHDTYIENYLKTGIPKAMGKDRELTAKRKDGSVFPIILALSESRILGHILFTGIITDITKRKESEQQIEQLRKKEQEIRARIQEVLLEARTPPQVMGLIISAVSNPSLEVNGDFFDFFKHSPDCVDLLVGDVMGKGVTAGLIGATIKYHFMHVLAELLEHPDCDAGQPRLPDVHHIVQSVHEHMTQDLLTVNQFVTLIYARINTRLRRIEYVNCGHNGIVHYQQKTTDCRFLTGDNLPLGVQENEVYEKVSTTLESDDLLVFYSDGLIEAMKPSMEIYGEERLVHMVQTQSNKAPDVILEAVMSDIETFTATDKHRDDITCIVIRATKLQDIA